MVLFLAGKEQGVMCQGGDWCACAEGRVIDVWSALCAWCRVVQVECAPLWGA